MVRVSLCSQHLSIEDRRRLRTGHRSGVNAGLAKRSEEMNGKEHTIICLEGESKIHMTIGGGLDVFCGLC